VLLTGDTSSLVSDRHRDDKLKLVRKPIQAEDLLTILKALLAD
jgi:hypothetical protein